MRQRVATRSSFPHGKDATWIMPRLTDSERAMLRSQSGPGPGLALSSVPACAALRIDSHHFPVLLPRRLRLPLPSVSRSCRCGHRAACSRAGVLGRRGYALECVGTRICREEGARVSTNVFVRDVDLLAPNLHNARRLELVAEGLPLHSGAQNVEDTTLVSAYHCDGTARHGAAHINGAAPVVARRRKERAYPELVGPRSRGKACGASWSGWRTVVGRDGNVLEVVGRRPSHAWEKDVGVRRRTCLCCFGVGAALQCWWRGQSTFGL